MLLTVTTTAQLLTLFLLYRTILPHFFSPVEWLALNIRYWHPEGTLQEPTKSKKKKKGRSAPPKSSNKSSKAKANLLLFSNNINRDEIQRLQGYAQVDWRFSMVVCSVILFLVGEITSCLVPEETSLEISSILITIATFGCIDYLFSDVLRSDKDSKWDAFSTYVTATFLALLICNAPLVLFDFRFKYAIRVGTIQYNTLLHHLGLNTTDIPTASGLFLTGDDAKNDQSVQMISNFIFTFITANFAGLITAILLKPSRVLAEAYVHRTDEEYTTSQFERCLAHIDFLYPILLIACWVPSLTSDFFTMEGLIQCDKSSILRDCIPTGPENITTTIENAPAGTGITETQWTSIRITVVMVGIVLKLCMCRRNLQAYLDRARFQYDTFIASSGMATMERVRNVLQYRIRVICPNMLALFAPYGFPLCLSMLLKQMQNVSYGTCSIFLNGLYTIGVPEYVGVPKNKNTTLFYSKTAPGLSALLDDEGKESVQWFNVMSNTGRHLISIYLEQMLNFILFWSLLSTFIMMSFFILSQNRKLENLMVSPMTSLANQIKNIGADPVVERRTSRKEQIKSRKGKRE
tara:strand:- start:339 stop:2069 length:1731 start_codon:yes stop_codon:yes gene_type:complete